MTSRFLRTLRAVIFVSLLAAVISLVAAKGQNTQPEDTSLTVESVIQLVQGGLSEELVISKIRQNGKVFDLSVNDLLSLKKASISDRIVKEMMHPEAPLDSPPSAKSPAQPAETRDPNAPPKRDIGVYYKKRGEWLDMLPEIVNWKTGGVLKSFASGGLIKGDVNGRINGPHSRNSATTPLEFLIYTAEGVAITEYQLLRLRKKKKAREFRTVTGGVLHASGGATRDLVLFEGAKLASRIYKVILPPNLGAGEYGFLPPGAVASRNSASLGKIYTFRLIE